MREKKEEKEDSHYKSSGCYKDDTTKKVISTVDKTWRFPACDDNSNDSTNYENYITS